MARGVQKGKRGERELAGLLSDFLGDIVVADPHGNGADIQSLPGLAIEVKRQETLNLKMWWAQAKRQADALDRIPVLAWRQNRTDWQFGLPASLLILGEKEEMVIVQRRTFLRWVHHWLTC